jgi:hypothetical protein
MGIAYAQGHYIAHPATEPIEIELAVAKKPARRRKSA